MHAQTTARENGNWIANFRTLVTRISGLCSLLFCFWLIKCKSIRLNLFKAQIIVVKIAEIFWFYLEGGLVTVISMVMCFLIHLGLHIMDMSKANDPHFI